MGVGELTRLHLTSSQGATDEGERISLLSQQSLVDCTYFNDELDYELLYKEK